MFRRKRRPSDFTAEIEAHLQLETDRLRAEGLTEDEARLTARRAFGNITRATERFYESGRWLGWDHLRQDLWFAWRMLRRNPGFAAAAMLTLALGIGVNTAIFSVVYAVLLHPLPFPQPQRIITVWSTRQGSDDVVTPRNFDAWQRESRSFSMMAAYESVGFNLSEGDHTVRIPGSLASSSLFAVFGVPPLLGRTFTAKEDMPGGPDVVVLSHRLWQEQFGSDPHILGRELHLNERAYTVIGVMPASYDLLSGSGEMWTPLRLNGAMMGWMGGMLNVVGRLKRSVSLRQARAEMDVLARNLAARYPQMNRGRGVRLAPLAANLVGDYRQRLTILFCAAALVLLIACTNVANLLLARGMARMKELAVRAALGASPKRILRQLLTETLLISLGAAAASLAIAQEGIQAVMALSPASVPRIREASINSVALAFALALALLCTLVAGGLPAWRLVRAELLKLLQQAGRGVTGFAGDKLRNAYVTFEVALTLVLVTAAGLLVRTAIGTLYVDPGFVASGVLTARTALPQARYKNAAQVSRVYERILDEMKDTPGVTAAALTSKAPLGSSSMGLLLKPGAVALPMKEDLATELRYVSPEYFFTLRIPLLQGRQFTARDRMGTAQVAMVNEALAKLLWPGKDPIGQWIRIPEIDTGGPVWEVVGLAGDTRDNGLLAAAPPALYIPYSQTSTNAWHWTQQSLYMVARTRSNPVALARPLERAVHSVDSQLPFSNVATLAQRLAESTATLRLYADLLTCLGICGLFLASMGIYAVLAYFVCRRMAEIGIRAALGATPGRLLLWLVWQGMRPVFTGIGLGLLASLAAAPLLAGQLYGVSGSDPMTLAIVTFVVASVATAACCLPALRAIRMDITSALRAE
jgi:putative ABC transport system permease protein